MTNSKYKPTITWSDEDQGYIAENELCPEIGAVGETPQEAEKIYYEMLEDYFQAEKDCRIRKSGRPAKQNVRLSCNIPSNVKSFIDLQARQRGVNQSTIIEEAVKIYQLHLENKDSAENLARDILKLFSTYGLNICK